MQQGVALRDIRMGEELTADYAMTDDEPYEMTYSCGRPSCRGTISGFDWRKPEIQAKYAGYFSWFIQRRIDQLPQPGAPRRTSRDTVLLAPSTGGAPSQRGDRGPCHRSAQGFAAGRSRQPRQDLACRSTPFPESAGYVFAADHPDAQNAAIDHQIGGK